MSVPENKIYIQDRLAWHQTVAYFATFIGLGLTAASLGPTLPGLAVHTQSNIGQISFLFTGRSFGYLLGSLYSGRMYDRFPGHRLIGVMLLVMAVMMTLTPAISLLWVLTAILFLLGIAEGTVDVGGNTLLVWVHHQRVGPFMNAMHFFFGLGAFIAPLVVGRVILAANDINWAYWLLAIYLVPVGLRVLTLPSPSPSLQSQAGDNRIAYPRLVALIVLFFFLYVGSEVAFGGWIYTYAVSLDLANPVTAAYLTSIYWGVFTLGRLLGVPLATRFRPATILTWDIIGCLLSMGIILLFPGSLEALAVGAAMLGLSTASMFPNMLVFAELHMPINGRVTGWFFVGVGAGAMFLPWLIGQLFEPIGPQVTMWLIFIDLVATAILLAVIFKYADRLAPRKT